MADIEKRGYKVYANWLNWIELLSKEQIAEWTLWIFNYMNNKELEISKDQALAMAINMAKNVIDIDKENYDKKVDAGKKGGIATQLKQRKAKSSTLKHNKAEESINEQNEADKIRYDMKRKDMICNDMVCNDISSNDNDGLNDFEYKMFLEDLESKIGYEPNPYDKEKIKSWLIKGYDLNGILKEVDKLLEKKVGNHSIINYINKSFSNVENGTVNQNKPIQVEEDIEEEKTTGSDWLDNYKKPVYSGSSKKVELIKPKNTEEEDVRKLQELQMKLEVVIGKDLIKTESDMLKKEYKKYSADSIIAETRNAILFGANKVDPVVEALKMLKKKSMEVNRI